LAVALALGVGFFKAQQVFYLVGFLVDVDL